MFNDVISRISLIVQFAIVHLLIKKKSVIFNLIDQDREFIACFQSNDNNWDFKQGKVWGKHSCYVDVKFRVTLHWAVVPMCSGEGIQSSKPLKALIKIYRRRATMCFCSIFKEKVIKKAKSTNISRKKKTFFSSHSMLKSQVPSRIKTKTKIQSLIFIINSLLLWLLAFSFSLSLCTISVPF